MLAGGDSFQEYPVKCNKKAPHCCEAFLNYGAATKSRTRDLMITNQLLYQLSYSGVVGRKIGVSLKMSKQKIWKMTFFFNKGGKVRFSARFLQSRRRQLPQHWTHSGFQCQV